MDPGKYLRLMAFDPHQLGDYFLSIQSKTSRLVNPFQLCQGAII